MSRHGSVTGAWLYQFLVYYNVILGMGKLQIIDQAVHEWVTASIEELC